MRTTELITILRIAIGTGADKALAACGGLHGGITKTAAYRLYGRANVDRWLQEGLIEIHNKHFERKKLAQVAAASNRITYLPVAER